MMMLQGHILSARQQRDNVVGWHSKRKSSFVPRVRAVGRYSSRASLGISSFGLMAIFSGTAV